MSCIGGMNFVGFREDYAMAARDNAAFHWRIGLRLGKGSEFLRTSP